MVGCQILVQLLTWAQSHGKMPTTSDWVGINLFILYDYPDYIAPELRIDDSDEEFEKHIEKQNIKQKLNKYMHSLMKMAEQFNLAVYVTNQVMANPAMMFGDPTTAIGGNSERDRAQCRHKCRTENYRHLLHHKMLCQCLF